MSVKIGEALIERGLLTRTELDQALRSQLILGGHLGTCLIEMGFIKEASLAATLGQILGLRHARSELFVDIPANVIRAVPRDLAKKLSVIPFGLEGRTLHVATIRPEAVSHLSRATGFKIVPYVAPEVCIVNALNKYYGIRPRQRYIKVSENTVPQGFRLSEPEPGIPLTIDIAPNMSGGAIAPPEPEPMPGAQGELDLDPVLALGALSREMSQVADQWQLAEVILEYASQRMKRCILFDVTEEHARVGSFKGDDLDPETLKQLVIPVSAESLFGLVLEESYYRGPVPGGLEFDRFFDRLGIDIPGEILILPIYGDERLEAILYGDGGTCGDVTGATESHLLMSENIALALKMLSFKLQLSAG